MSEKAWSEWELITRHPSGPRSTSPTFSTSTASLFGAEHRSAFFVGNILANPILRWMGCRIGHRTIVVGKLSVCSGVARAGSNRGSL